MKRLWLRAVVWYRRESGRTSLWVTVLLVSLAAMAAIAMSAGAVDVPLRGLPAALLDRSHPLHGVLVDVRLPRVLCAALVGASLGCAGALMQTVVRNPLADPGLIGVSAFAGVAVLLAIVLRPESSLSLPTFAFLGASTGLALLVAGAWTHARTPAPIRIILAGVALQALGFGLIAIIQFFFADRAPAFAAFVVGSLNGMAWRDVGILIGPTLLGIGLALLGMRTLNLLLFDDATAGGVGLAVRRARLAVSGLSAVLAAGAVSVAGLVAFVGLIVPNGVRLLTGPDHRALLPLAALGGALLVLTADTVGRTVVAPLELPVGALLAILGGPYFLILLRRKLV
ncbi:MAG: FecCD family ABC transporter permease [Myxococcota bacterium]